MQPKPKARLAQLVEHLIDVERVAGSSPASRTMKILAIETSCDETAVAVLEATGDTSGATYRVLGDALYSQASKHAEYGGVYPNLAKREHQENLPRLFEEAYSAAGKPPLDLIAVTKGPGLEPALWQGITFAEKLKEELDVPVIGIDHMEGHILAALVEKNEEELTLKQSEFPILSLLISGGHTELLLMNRWFKYELVGRTRDDAVGEAFDKVARLLGMPYPGGPEIDRAAKRAREKGAQNTITLPRPMINNESCDFSFSGLKTAVLYLVKEKEALSEEDKEQIAEEFENAVRDVLVSKTKRAIELHNPRSLVVGGGVSANAFLLDHLRELTEAYPDTSFAYPAKGLSGDNAIMIGVAGHLRHVSGHAQEGPLKATGSQTLE